VKKNDVNGGKVCKDITQDSKVKDRLTQKINIGLRNTQDLYAMNLLNARSACRDQSYLPSKPAQFGGGF
jgi:hypothetical protein